MVRTKQTIVIVQLVLLLGLAGCGKQERTVATVDGEQITAAELDLVVKRNLRESGKTALSPGEQERILDQVVDRRLLYREGIHLGLVPAPAEIDAAVAALRQKAGGDAPFRALLQVEGRNEAEFRKETEQDLVVTKMEAKLAGQVKVDQQEALHYYEQHKADFTEPASYRVHLIQTDSQQDADHLLKRYRNDAAAFDRQALHSGPSELQSINRKAFLTPQENFPDQMQPLLAKSKKGEIGGPVRAKRGYFLFHLLQKGGGQQKSWGQVREVVTHLLYQEKKEAAIKEWLSQQHDRVRTMLNRQG